MPSRSLSSLCVMPSCWNKVRKQYQCPPRISCCAMRRYKARLTARPVSAMRKPMLSSSSESKVEGSVCADINLDWYLIKNYRRYERFDLLLQRTSSGPSQNKGPFQTRNGSPDCSCLSTFSP